MIVQKKQPHEKLDSRNFFKQIAIAAAGFQTLQWHSAASVN
jgi:hypothetical protein